MNKIWQSPKYMPYVQPALTNEALAEAEKQIGYKLPVEYIELLKIQNGGYIRYSIEDTVHFVIKGIGPYYPSILGHDWSDFDDWELSFELNGLVPFDGDGHWYICFDYRNQQLEPEITYIDTESDEEIHIAKSFKEYLTLLVIDENDEHVIETNLNIDAAVKQISAIATIDFEAPDAWAHGYAVYRSKYKDKWVWISPNKVPSGFIRIDDERYDELKSQMETSDLRFPEIPGHALLISTSDGKATKSLIAELAKNGFSIKPLTAYL
jgi:hypothetical protein